MARPKGSTNKPKTEFTPQEIENLQARVNELEKSTNSYTEVLEAFVDGFIIDIQQNLKTVSLETLQKWFNPPDPYSEQMSNLLS